MTRTTRIGLRVAVGARRRDIVTQFLAESLILAGMGGVLGIALGLGAARLVSAVTTWNARVTALPLVVATLGAAAVGLLFGVLPALRAARLNPIDALHAE